MSTQTHIPKTPGAGRKGGLPRAWLTSWLTSSPVTSWLPLLFIIALMLLLNACGGSGSASSNASDGEVVIGLTDAAGDSASYTVDVRSLSLTRSDGVEVETLPLVTRVDFAQYTDLTEFLTAATVPGGVYTQARMTLDYRNADIRVEDPSGNLVPVGQIVDADGNPLETLSVDIRLDDRNALLITPGTPAHITLDFDLKASNRVDFSGAEPVLTVAPFMVADVEFDHPKPHRLRGALDSVAPEAHHFTLRLRPFHHPLRGDHRRFGAIKVFTGGDAVFDIDGQSYQGDEGLRALAAQPPLTAVIAIGDMQRREGRMLFVAKQVYAGSSVPNGDADVATGHVISRNGNSLQLKGATLLRRDGSVVFNDVIRIELANSTVVKKQFSTQSFGIGDISVGQRLTVFGQLGGDASTGFVLDATQGTARMLLTTVGGDVAQTASPLALNLHHIGPRPVALFDFSGTGVDSANDADPGFYEVDTGSLPLAGIALNEPLKVRGFVRGFGQAPEDFDARTLVQIANVKALMSIDWSPASNTAISDLRDDGMLLSLSGVGRFHHVVRRGVFTDLEGFANAPRITPPASGEGVYVIIDRQATALAFRRFADFSRALGRHLDNGAAVRSLKVNGHFDDSQVIMTARGIRIHLQ